MAKIEIVDECLAPGNYIYLYYSGKNPFSVIDKIQDSLVDFFKITAAGWCQYDFRYNNIGDPHQYFVQWWVVKTMSKHSKIRFNIKVQGDEGVQTKEGKFTLELTAKIEHEFEPSNWFLRGIWWMYRYMLYDRVRRTFLERCLEHLYRFRNMLREDFGMMLPEKESVT